MGEPTPDRLPVVHELIPHRGRFLLVDRLMRFDDQTLEAVYSFAAEEIEGHFPDHPVVPGVLLLEGLAQTLACLGRLLASGAEQGGVPYLAGFEKVRFRAPVIPPAEVHYRVRVVETLRNLTVASGQVTCEGRRVCTARLRALRVPSPE